MKLMWKIGALALVMVVGLVGLFTVVSPMAQPPEPALAQPAAEANAKKADPDDAPPPPVNNAAKAPTQNAGQVAAAASASSEPKGIDPSPTVSFEIPGQNVNPNATPEPVAINESGKPD